MYLIFNLILNSLMIYHLQICILLTELNSVSCSLGSSECGLCGMRRCVL